jgi:ribonuclease Z
MIFSVTILGSGAASPTSRRFPSAQVIQVNEQSYLMDCAEGAQIQIRRFHLKMNRLKAIFISHLHGDHVFGLPGLLSTLSMSDRTEPLEIFGSKQLDEWLTGQLKFFTPLSFPVNIHRITTGEPVVIYEDKRVAVSAFPLKHRIPTWGYLFREKEKLRNIRKDMIQCFQIPLRQIPGIKAGADYHTIDGRTIANDQLTLPAAKPRSYAYCSDTVYLPHLPEIVRDVNLLYHEATFANTEKQRAVETFHATAEEAALVAKAANAGKLIIGHISSRYEDVKPLLQEAQAVFPHTEIAEDGNNYAL